MYEIIYLKYMKIYDFIHTQNHIFSLSIQILKFKFISILYLFTEYHANISCLSISRKRLLRTYSSLELLIRKQKNTTES